MIVMMMLMIIGDDVEMMMIVLMMMMTVVLKTHGDDDDDDEDDEEFCLRWPRFHLAWLLSMKHFFPETLENAYVLTIFKTAWTLSDELILKL